MTREAAPERRPRMSGAQAPGPPTRRRPGTRRRSSSAALVRIEARHLARSPLLWLGAALGAALVALELSWYLPALAGDDVIVYRSGALMISGGALLAGAWAALRDRVAGTADLVAVTPTAPRRPWRARLAGVAVAAAGVFAVAFAAGLAVSVARGGRGTPDLRLLADGMLVAVLGGLVGVAVGRSSGSRLLSVLAAPVWVALSMLVGGQGQTEAPLTVQNLAPVLFLLNRSAAYGFLPDPLWPHLGYLLGLTVLAGALLVALGARGEPRLALKPVLAVAAVGLILAGAAGSRLLALPDALLVLGPDRGTWKPVQGDLWIATEAVTQDPGWSFPTDGHARSCLGDATLSVCVYPAYGQRLARSIHQTVAPVAAAFTGLPGVPTRVRMVPIGDAACGDGEVQVGEPRVREPSTMSDQQIRFHHIRLYLDCALGIGRGHHPADPHPGGEARAVVSSWALLASGVLTRQDLAREAEEGPLSSRAAAAAALAMAELPPDRVRAELAPVWERLRAGTLPAAELPGQRP
jgi:hypothetical protein